MTASPNWEGTGHSGVPMGVSPSSNVWSSRVQWGAIIAGALAGFGAFIIMTTLGAALGITAGTVAGHNTESADSDTANKAAMAFSIGSGVWMLLTAAVVGITGGCVLNNTSRRDRPYSPAVFGLVTWAGGVCMLLLLAAPLFGGVISGIGAGAGGAAAGLGGNPQVQSQVQKMTDQVRGMQPGQSQQSQDQNRQMTDEQKAAAADAAKKAATGATIVAWTTLIGQLVGLFATIIAAGYHRTAKVKVVTELRPRAAALT